MGYGIGFDEEWKRDIGYAVPAYCDHPGCDAEIDRGLSYVCGGEPFGGDDGCGLYFCYEHLFFGEKRAQECNRCFYNEDPFEPKPDHPDWIKHKLTDESWEEWRQDNPEKVAAMRGSQL